MADVCGKNIITARTDQSYDWTRDDLACQKRENDVDAGLPEGKFHMSREIRLTQISVLLTLIVSVMLFREIYVISMDHFKEASYWHGIEQMILGLIVLFFIYGNVVYQLTRLGYLKRLMAHRPASREELERIYDGPAPDLTILIPSYKEEARVIKQSLLSAALQEYPNRRVVLLIDDPPTPVNPEDLSGLLTARRLPSEVQKFLEGPAAKLEAEFSDFILRKGRDLIVSEEYLRLAGLYREIAIWFKQQAAAYPVQDHTDCWFVKKTFLEPARSHFFRATRLERHAKRGDGSRDDVAIEREFRRLASLFKVELTSFERKRYGNLSHEPNKAMNLNSYIGLLGKTCCETERNGKTYLEHSQPDECGFLVPQADYLITLDADSLLLPEYALRLVHVMELPGNQRLAVAQTPYNAVPNATGILERIAGATTDIQYIIHQGFTRYDATYWVGANALLRRSALEDISMAAEERGFTVTRYIQDRTVIEDTESSIDLIDRGWKLYNYPDRLSYSATPPDFGSLLIQRRRWANGGLIILPKLLRNLFRDIHVYRRLREGLNRVHYLTSLAGVNIGLLLILLYPFEPDLRVVAFLSVLFFINAFIYGRDLVQSGYRISDLLRVYALNLMLIPINLGGVFKSVHQAWTGQKIPFGRTPKVMGRTAAPASYVMTEFAILLLSITSSFANFILGRWLYAAFSAVNSIFFLYIVNRYIGLSEAKEDLQGWWLASRIQRALIRQIKSYSPLIGITILLILMLMFNISLTNAY